MGEAKRRKKLDANYGKPKFDPDLPNWVLEDEWDTQDALKGQTLADCLACVGIETAKHFRERLQKAVDDDFVFAPDFQNSPNDDEFNRVKAIATHTGEISIQERWLIKYSQTRIK
ncbi:hypothetical protein NIES22_73730 (plasmid) [Calothrix brevissima NIES-22]|nr:hypothetical protein NIES22_73730 [Calothrix brevissima NIES-22]